MSTKCLVVLSGGQDSTTCLYLAKTKFKEVHAVTYDYGQRHARELEAARVIGQRAGVASHHVLSLGRILVGSSPLVSSNHLEQYDDMYNLPGGLEKTFVPGRNLLFLTLAANLAYSMGITDVFTGVCQEDFGGYPDCRETFILAAEDAIREGFSYNDEDGFGNFRIHTPLMHMTKADSVRLAASLPGCFDALAYSHTSYDGQYPPTGSDHATLLRAKGFVEARYADPLVVRAWKEGLMDLPPTENYDHLRAEVQA